MAVATEAPRGEIGAQFTPSGGSGWQGFIDDYEMTPNLAWPSSIRTYHDMRSESQVEALHMGTTQPVREFRWAIDPNRAKASIVEQVAMDFGLPIRGHEDDAIPRSHLSFSFDQFLADTLLAPLYGFFYFEVVGDVNGDATEWHFDNLSPRHPRTIGEFQTAPNGDLVAVRQNIAPAIQMPGGAAFHVINPIPAVRLIPFVWRKEAGSWVGRSMLRSLYREFLVKDRTMRVAAVNIERAGGMPVIEGPQGASDAQLANLAMLARQFKVAEGGGGAIPFGSKLNLIGGNTPDAISLLQYCDEAMARVWALMLVQLGMTQTGNRALGGEFATYAARAQRSMAKWVVDTVNRFIDRYVQWNLGDSAKYAPLLTFEQSKPDAMSTVEMVSLIEAGALTVDPELESWLRNEHGLPPMPEPQTDPNLGDLSPDEVALVQGSRNPPALPDGQPLPKPAGVPPASDAAYSSQTNARMRAPINAAITLPVRKLRRQPYPQEVRAAVDFAGIDAAHETAKATIESLYRTTVLPAQIDALEAQVTTTKQGQPRQRLTRSAMAALQAPQVGRDDMVKVLAQAAEQGAQGALAEMSAQGATASLPDDYEALVGDQASAVAAMIANGLSLAAQRKASALVGGGRTPRDVGVELRGHLQGMKHEWSSTQLQGAVSAAQNAGRQAVFATVPDQAAMSYYASELLDVATCGPCTDVDGTQYATLADAEQDYPGSQYVDCAGGPRCRGTVVAVYGEQDTTSFVP